VDSAATFTPRPASPRLAPLGPGESNETQRALLAGSADYNIYKTFAHHLAFARAFGPFGRFTLNGSGLAPRAREIVVLRMGWLCQSEYEWSQHARIAKSGAGLTDADIRRVAEGPAAAGWCDFERALLRMVDELRYDATVSDATWQALRVNCSEQQMIESVLTAGQYQFVSMALNSLGIQLDPGLQDRLPRDLALPALATQPVAHRLEVPRVQALANHPSLYGPYVQFDRYVRRESLLPSKARELLIMRTAENIRDGYGWAHHAATARAAGLTDDEVAAIATGAWANCWNEEQAALLRAADELHREAFISDGTWQTLLKYFDHRQMIDLIATVGASALTGLMTNSLGIQVDHQP